MSGKLWIDVFRYGPQIRIVIELDVIIGNILSFMLQLARKPSLDGESIGPPPVNEFFFFQSEGS